MGPPPLEGTGMRAGTATVPVPRVELEQVQQQQAEGLQRIAVDWLMRRLFPDMRPILMPPASAHLGWMEDGVPADVRLTCWRRIFAR